MQTILTLTYLRERLSYDPLTGLFIWKKLDKRASKGRVGAIAGYRHNAGYWTIAVNQKKILAHRLAFLFMTGQWPSHEIDHINGNRADNRWSNLREATSLQNKWNRRASGIHWDKANQKWFAQINHNNFKIFLGRFKSEAEATLAYQATAKKLRGGFAFGVVS